MILVTLWNIKILDNELNQALGGHLCICNADTVFFKSLTSFCQLLKIYQLLNTSNGLFKAI